MSHADPGPLATYNSLQDKHLSGYFSNSRMKRHLQRSGLVTKSGKIIDERTYRLNMAKKEHRKHVRDLLATAIVHKTLDMERMRQYEIRKRLDEVYKIELVKRVKEDRKRKGDEDILPLLSPRERTARQMCKAKQGNSDRERPATAPSTYADYRAEEETPLKPSELVYNQDMGKIVYRANPSTFPSGNGYLQDDTEDLGPSPYTRVYSSTYPAPAPPASGTPRHARRHSTPRRGVRVQRFHYLAKTEPAVAHRIQLQSMAEVTMKFLGPSLVLTNSMFPEDRLSEVMVLQQHCGGSTLCVFRELLPANTIFTFISRRHRGAPFGLTFYIDGMQDIRLSSCCEYKHKPGHVLGGKNGHFQFVVVEGAAPCYRCQIASSYSKNTKRKHKTSQYQGEEDQNPKTFLTETSNEEEEAGETFDVIITKINPPKSEEDESKDAGEMVDNSTQTPRGGDDNANKESEKEEDKTETIISEEAISEVTPDQIEQEEEDAPDDAEAEKYEDDDFENDEEKEMAEKESDSVAKNENENEEQETKDKDEYNEDFESEKEEDEPEVEEEKEDDNKEESEDEILDETRKESAVIDENEEDPKEVDDETEEKIFGSSARPDSATDSEDKLSKNVSFDEDVTVIEDENEEPAKTTEDVPEEEGAEEDQEKPEEERERNQAASDDGSQREAEEVPEEEEEPRSEDQEVSKEEDEASELLQELPREIEDERKEFEELLLSRKLGDSSSSSESSESSEDSENEDEENEMKKKKKKRKTKPGHDPGSDPDLVSTGKLPDQALKAVGVQPGTKHEGSVQSLLEGKEDVDLAGVSLTRKQLEEVSSIVLARDYVGSVVLRNTGVDDHSVQRLCAAVKNASTTKMVNLSVNQLGPAGARHIADVIRENKTLRMLLLHGNPLTNEGVRIIVDAILETPDTSLLNLDLGDCGVSDDGAKSISDLIENNRTISQLTISGNNIGRNGWQSIAEALKANTTLGTLSLDFNKIGDEEAAIIAEGLRECKSLRCIDLEGNKIGDDGGRKLLEAVKANKSVIDLTLMPVNRISKDILDELKQVLEERVKKGSEAERDGEGNDVHGSVQEADTEAEQKDEAGKTRENAVQSNQQHDNQTEGEQMDPDTKDSVEVPIVEKLKKDEQEDVDRKKGAISEDIVVEDSDHHDEDKEKADEKQQPSGSGPGDEQEKQENMPNAPENVPHIGETDKYRTESEPPPNETEQAPLKSVVEPLDTGQSPPEKVPQPSEMGQTPVGGISQQSETGQNPSEDFQHLSRTEQEWSSGQSVREEGKEAHASRDSALPQDQETTSEGPNEVGESPANETEVDKSPQEETRLGDDESERVITTTLT